MTFYSHSHIRFLVYHPYNSKTSFLHCYMRTQRNLLGNFGCPRLLDARGQGILRTPLCTPLVSDYRCNQVKSLKQVDIIQCLVSNRYLHFGCLK